MSVLSGRKIGYAIGREGVGGSRGVAVAPTHGIPHIDGDFKPRGEKIINDSSIGVLANANGAAIVKEWAEGDITSKFTPNAGGLLLLAGFGNVVSSDHADANAAVRSHLFTMSEDNLHPSFTLVRKEANQNKRYALGTCRSWEMEVVVGEYVKVTTSWIAKDGVVDVDTITYAEEAEFTPKYAMLKRAATIAGFGAADPLKVRRFRVKIEKTVADDYVFGSNSPDEFYVTEYNVGGEIEQRYENLEHYELYKSDSTAALQLTLENTDVNIGAAAHPGLVLQLPAVTLDEWDLDQGKDAVVSQTVGFKGLFSIAEAQAIQAVLTNTQNNYNAPA